MGAMPTTLLSTSPVNHVVQPRFEAPATTKLSILVPQSRSENCWSASIARTAALVMGYSAGQVVSPVSRYLLNV